MDRETQDQYLVLLQAKDMGGHLGGLSGTTTVTVKLSDVNDNPPRFTQSESSTGGTVGRLGVYSGVQCDCAMLVGAVRGLRGCLFYDQLSAFMV